MKLRIKRLSWKIRRLYYKCRYGIVIGFPHGTMLPQFGKGKFVSVFRKGNYLEITAHTNRHKSTKGMIRLIPYQPNHGVMVEFVKDGKVQWRTHCDYDQFYNMGFNSQEKAA